MGALANAAILARNDTFRDRILAAVMFQARAVLAEDPATANHIFRASYARSVLLTPLQYQDSFAWTMAGDSSIAALGSDPDLIPEDVLVARVAIVWNALITPVQ